MPVLPGPPYTRPLQPVDLPFAAALHAAALPHGFFARLGSPFLRVYYTGYLRSPYAVALVAERHGDVREPLGVLVGTLDTAAHNRWVLRHHGLRLALAGAVALLTRPRELRLFLRTRVGRYLRAVARARGRAPAASPAPEGGAAMTAAPAVLTHVAVTPAARGNGSGRALVQAFLAAARQAGRTEAQLVTLAEPGTGAGKFYVQLGWTVVRERPDHDGRPVRLYRTTL